jgi:predicted amidohydrolase
MVGTEKDTVFGGLSRIVAPNTTILAGADTETETVISATFCLDAIEEQRQQIPYLRDLEIKKFPY